MKSNQFYKYLFINCRSEATAERYFYAVKKMLSTLREKTGLEYVEELTPDLIKNYFENDLKTKHDVSATKNGLLHLEEFSKERGVTPNDDFFAELNKKKRQRKVYSDRVICLDTTKRKVNAIRNEKFKLALRLMMVSGLRVFETANVGKNDITINGDIITVFVSNGKGGKSGFVECMPDPYLAKRLGEHMAKHDGGKLFYAAGTMKEYAKKRGIQCHDMRRIASFTKKQQMLSAGFSVYEANGAVKEFLRHSKFATTRRYLPGSKYNKHLIIIKKRSKPL